MFKFLTKIKFIYARRLMHDMEIELKSQKCQIWDRFEFLQAGKMQKRRSLSTGTYCNELQQQKASKLIAKRSCLYSFQAVDFL